MKSRDQQYLKDTLQENEQTISAAASAPKIHPLGILFSLASGLLFAWYAFFQITIPLVGKEFGYSPLSIALIGSATNIATICAPLIYTTLAFYARSVFWSMFSSVLLGSIILGIAYYRDFNELELFSILLVAAILIQGPVALLEISILKLTENNIFRFAHIRIWGSIGFAIAIFIFSWALNNWHLAGALAVQMIICICSALVLISLKKHLRSIDPKGRYQKNLFEFLYELTKHPQFILTTAIATLHWISIFGVYSFLPIHLANTGWDNQEISQVWAISIGCEVIMFILYDKLFRDVTPKKTLMIALLGTAIRWPLLGVNFSAILVGIGFALHAFSISIFLLANRVLSRLTLPEEIRDRGQGVHTAISVGIGSLIGRFIAAEEIRLLGGYSYFFEVTLFFTIFSACALLLSSKLAKDLPYNERKIKIAKS